MNSGISTEELNHQIEEATDIEDYFISNREHMLSGSMSEHLMALLAEKKISKADVVRGSLLDRAYVYQIFSGEKRPSRDKLLALALACGLPEMRRRR